MSMQDPISDMLAMIKNAQARNKVSVTLPSSKHKVNIAKVLLDEGYINGYKVSDDKIKPQLEIELKYFKGKPVIESLIRVSKPSLRCYKSKKLLPNYKDGLGIAIVSTSKGVMSNKRSRTLGIGGEIICYVS
ncbi:MAG: 30S ribosomal protein S8 [Pseudomonadota bacterium]